MILATLAAKGDLGTLTIGVASKYEETKKKFVQYSSGTLIPFYAEGIDKISNPHMPISYYVLSCKI